MRLNTAVLHRAHAQHYKLTRLPLLQGFRPVLQTVLVLVLQAGLESPQSPVCSSRLPVFPAASVSSLPRRLPAEREIWACRGISSNCCIECRTSRQ